MSFFFQLVLCYGLVFGMWLIFDIWNVLFFLSSDVKNGVFLFPQESVSFSNDRQGFELVDKFQQTVISNDIYVDSGRQEIVFSEFSRLGQEVCFSNYIYHFYYMWYL